MITLEESVVTAMDGSDTALFPYLPYILQDIWEIGADPDVMIRLIRKHFNQYDHLKILDLGCGAGQPWCSLCPWQADFFRSALAFFRVFRAFRRQLAGPGGAPFVPFVSFVGSLFRQFFLDIFILSGYFIWNL